MLYLGLRDLDGRPFGGRSGAASIFNPGEEHPEEWRVATRSFQEYCRGCAITQLPTEGTGAYELEDEQPPRRSSLAFLHDQGTSSESDYESSECSGSNGTESISSDAEQPGNKKWACSPPRQQRHLKILREALDEAFEDWSSRRASRGGERDDGDVSDDDVSPDDDEGGFCSRTAEGVMSAAVGAVQRAYVRGYVEANANMGSWASPVIPKPSPLMRRSGLDPSHPES